jgi:hypothetical protein
MEDQITNGRPHIGIFKTPDGKLLMQPYCGVCAIPITPVYSLGKTCQISIGASYACDTCIGRARSLAELEKSQSGIALAVPATYKFDCDKWENFQAKDPKKEPPRRKKK